MAARLHNSSLPPHGSPAIIETKPIRMTLTHQYSLLSVPRLRVLSAQLSPRLGSRARYAALVDC
jgi:hypothetical protein